MDNQQGGALHPLTDDKPTKAQDTPALLGAQRPARPETGPSGQRLRITSQLSTSDKRQLSY